MELVWLGQSTDSNLMRVGGKVAHLSRLAAKYPVPPGFCLTTAVFEQWANETAQNATVSPKLYNLLVIAYATLGERCKTVEPSVAVRSSAVDEDGPTASFAGQYETYLNVIGADAIARAVVRCWASVHQARVQTYYRQHGMSTENVQLAVLVQQLIAADISSVVFSANPVNGKRDEIVINSSWGLGESLVGGTVTPDTYVVRKSDLTLMTRQVAEKQQMTVMTSDGTQEVAVPRIMRRQPAMTDVQAVEMARLALALEEEMGWPVDIECAHQNGTLYLLQCRPITTLT